MKNRWIAMVACVLAVATAAAQDPASTDAAGTAALKGQTLVAANGSRLGAVYRVDANGSAQIILDGKMVTVPVSTLSSVDGKLTTSLSKSEVLALH